VKTGHKKAGFFNAEMDMFCHKSQPKVNRAKKITYENSHK